MNEKEIDTGRGGGGGGEKVETKEMGGGERKRDNWETDVLSAQYA